MAMPHPLLQGSNVDTVLGVPRGIRVAEFVQKPAAAVRSLSAAIDLYFPVFQLVRHSTMLCRYLGQVSYEQLPAVADPRVSASRALGNFIDQ